MKTCITLSATLLALALPASALASGQATTPTAGEPAPASADSAQEEPRESRFGRLAEGFRKATGISLTRSGQETRGSNLAIYTPVEGSGTLPGLFARGDRDLAIQGQLQWPRVALTFVEYGRSLPCWTVEARIWSSASASTVERFRTCLDAPLTKVDDMGGTSRFSKHDALTRAKLRRFQGAQPLFGYVETTGSQRTAGPNPPRKLFQVDVPADIEEKVFDASINAMWIAGFFTLEDTGMASSFMDWRMWIAGFEPAGNRDRR